VDAFLQNAERIFEVARSDNSAGPGEFALLIGADGGLHFVMESPLALMESGDCGAATAYRVTKTDGGGVRVAGRSGNRECTLIQHGVIQHGARRENPARRFSAELLRDQPLYRISSELTISAGS